MRIYCYQKFRSLKFIKNEGEGLSMNTKLSLKVKVSYGLGDFGSCLISMMIAFNFSYFCSVILGLPLAVVGFLTLSVQVWDAINDIYIGHRVDRTHTKEGKARPWLKRFALPDAIVAVLIFAVPTSFNIPTKIIWVAIAYFIYVLFHTCIVLPYSSLMPLITKDSMERASLSTFRMIGASCGSLVVASTAQPLIGLFSSYIENKAMCYGIVMLIYAFAAFIMFMTVYRNCPEVTQQEEEVNNVNDNLAKAEDKGKLLYNIKALLKNRAWVVTFLIGAILFIRTPFYGSALIYYFTYYLGLPEAQSSIMATFGTVAGLLAYPFVGTVIRKLDHKKTIIVSSIIMSLGMLGAFFAGKNISIAIILYCIDMFAESFAFVSVVSMVADSIDYGDYLFHVRLEGLGFAAYSFATKAAPAMGNLLLSLVLIIGGLDTTQGLGGVQTDSAIMAVRASMFFIPAVMAPLVGILAVFYPLNKKKNAEIEEILKERSIR